MAKVYCEAISCQWNDDEECVKDVVHMIVIAADGEATCEDYEEYYE